MIKSYGDVRNNVKRFSSDFEECKLHGIARDIMGKKYRCFECIMVKQETMKVITVERSFRS